MNIKVKLKSADLQFVSRNLLIMKECLTSLELDGVCVFFYNYELDLLYFKIAKKALTELKRETNVILTPASSYVIMQLWLQLPADIFVDLNSFRKIIAAIDQKAVSHKVNF